MPLTASEELLCYEILEIPPYTGYLNDTPVSLDDINTDTTYAAYLTRVQSITTEYATIQNDADRMTVDGVNSDPARTERKLRNKLANIFGIDASNTGIAIS